MAVELLPNRALPGSQLLVRLREGGPWLERVLAWRISEAAGRQSGWVVYTPGGTYEEASYAEWQSAVDTTGKGYPVGIAGAAGADLVCFEYGLSDREMEGVVLEGRRRAQALRDADGGAEASQSKTSACRRSPTSTHHCALANQ